MPRRLIVLSAPSGAGKTTITHRLLQRNPAWKFSVSATTRTQRANETPEEDYHFLSREEFQEKISSGDLVEYEEIFGNLYGTLKSEVARVLGGSDVARMIFDIDVKGAIAIRNAYPDDAFLVFIAPPSFEELRRRLEARQSESPESLARRIERARMEIPAQSEFDAVVVNDDIERAAIEIEQLIAAQR